VNARSAAALLMLLLAACLSPGPEPPPVRWFDPIPDLKTAAPASGKSVRLARVTAAAWMDRRFALRVGEREFTFDDRHRWIAEPQVLVTQALEQALFGSGAFTRAEGPGAVEIEVHVTDFALDLRAAPAADCALQALLPGGGVATFRGHGTAADRSPAELAKAMADALLQAVLALRAQLVAP
jgi:hypothetical protein